MISCGILPSSEVLWWFFLRSARWHPYLWAWRAAKSRRQYSIGMILSKKRSNSGRGCLLDAKRWKKNDHWRRWAGRWSICKESLNYDPDPKNWLKEAFFFCQKARKSKQFCFITFCCIVLLHVFRSERTLLEARSQKHMKALCMFLQEMCWERERWKENMR